MGISETLLQGMAEATCVGVFTTDERLTITGWNQWLEVNSGIRAEDVVNRPLFEAFPELVTRRLDRYYRQALSGQMVLLAQRLHHYLLSLHPSGAGSGLAQMPQSARIAPILERGVVVGTATMIEDVTERVVHETALRARAREQAAVATLSQRALGGGDFDSLQRETIATLASVFGVKDSQVVIWQTNIAAASPKPTVGLGAGAPRSDADKISMGLRSIVDYVLQAGTAVVVDDTGAASSFPLSPYLRECGVSSVINVPLRRGKSPFGVLTVYKHTPRAFNEENIRLLQAVANILGLAAERIHLERELRQRADDLAAEARRKDEFLAMLAHELRNPLAPIRNAVQIIRLTTSGDPALEATGIVDRQVLQMVHLVDDLLDVSRISRGTVLLRKEKLDLTDIVVQAVESVRPLIDSRKHELTLSLPSRPVSLDGDMTRLIQVLSNLLNNAAKYTDIGGHIWLTAAQEGDQAVIRVRDNGIGIRGELIPKVFDLFVQSERALDRSEGGLGIGLTLAKSLVELHHGTLSASSEGIGLGSEFIVRLPCDAESDRAPIVAETDSETEGPLVSAPRRILVVDDNVDSATSMAILLRLHSHDVRVAYDGPAALAQLAESLPEFVFLDIGLPGMNGYEVVRKIRAAYGRDSLVVVAMTGYGQEDDRRQALEAGFDGHLVKPVDLDALGGFLRQGTGPNNGPASESL